MAASGAAATGMGSAARLGGITTPVVVGLGWLGTASRVGFVAGDWFATVGIDGLTVGGDTVRKGGSTTALTAGAALLGTWATGLRPGVGGGVVIGAAATVAVALGATVAATVGVVGTGLGVGGTVAVTGAVGTAAGAELVDAAGLTEAVGTVVLDAGLAGAGFTGAGFTEIARPLVSWSMVGGIPWARDGAAD